MLTDEQLEQRKRGLGASDIPAVCGLNPWRAPIDVWLEKTGRAEPVPYTPRMRMGDLMEPVIADWYGEQVGAHELVTMPTMLNGDEPWMLATPDRLVSFEGDTPPRLLEVKLVGGRLAHHWPGDVVPEYVHVQALWQMRVVGIHLSDVAAAVGGTEPQIIPVEYVSEIADDLAEIGRDFWTRYVEKDEPPPVDATSSWTRHLLAKWPAETRPVVRAPASAEAWARKLATVRTQQSSLDVERKRCENELKSLIADAAGFDGVGWRVTWRKAASGGTDWKGLAQHVGYTKEEFEEFKRDGARRFVFTELEK